MCCLDVPSISSKKEGIEHSSQFLFPYVFFDKLFILKTTLHHVDHLAVRESESSAEISCTECRVCSEDSVFLPDLGPSLFFLD